MRDVGGLLGLVVLHLLIGAPGAAFLYLIGLLRARPWSVVLAAGPALVAGLVLLGVPLISLLAAGFAIPTWFCVALAVVMTAALVGAGRRRGFATPIDLSPGLGRVETWIATVVAIGVMTLFGLGALGFTNLPTFWDDANIWSLKAVVMYSHGELSDGLFRNPSLSWVHLDYPILQPLLEAQFFRALGGIDLRLWHAELWLLCGALIWTFAWLLATVTRTRIWALVVGVLAVGPIVIQNVTLGDADAMMAAFLGCSTLAFGLWLQQGRFAHAVLGALLLGGAANVKNEGLAFGVAIGVALVSVVVIGRVRVRLRDMLVTAGVAVACIGPWLIWVATNDAAVRATPSPWTTLRDPAGLADRADLFWRGLEQVALQLVTTSSWGYLVPVFLVVAVVLLATGIQQRVVAFYIAAWTLAVLTLAYMYWVTPIGELAAFEQRTGPRIALGVAFIAGAGLAHLLAIAATVAAPRAEVELEPQTRSVTR